MSKRISQATVLSTIIAAFAIAPLAASAAPTHHHRVHRVHRETHHRRPADKNPARRVGGYVQSGSRHLGGEIKNGVRHLGGEISGHRH